MSLAFTWLASQIHKALFWPEPASILSEEKKAAFERVFQAMLEGAAGQAVNYDCPYPKWEYLRYLAQNKGVVLHGSNRTDIEVLQPREQSDYGGKRITAVFAARDGIWPMFFAVVNMQEYRGSLRNGCWVVNRGGGKEQRFYFFSLGAEMLQKGIWTEGMVYILPGKTFQLTNRGDVRFDEWASPAAVKPLGKLALTPDDFPFLRQVAGHKEGESRIISWLQYKSRCGKRAAQGGEEIS